MSYPASVCVYTIPNCVFCSRVKQLFNRLRITYTEVFCVDAQDLPGDLHTFPQVYFGPKYIGGCKEVYDLYREGKLG
ncbi:MAG: glutaredoxin domain-containing protein [Polynucleobacter sp.]